MPTDPTRVDALRQRMRHEQWDAFLVPREDQHQGEYVPEYAQRLSWLTGFEGSAGQAIVLLDQAAIFVDGRYTLQVRQQVDTELFNPIHIMDERPHDWLGNHLGPEMVLAYDPWLHTVDWVQRLEAACEKAGSTLCPVQTNPIDEIWTDQPPPPTAPIKPHPLRFSGVSSVQKRQSVGRSLEEAGEQAAILTDPASIAWLLNVRGGDVEHTPLPLSFALIHQNGEVDWFVREAKVSSALIEHVGPHVRLHAPEALAPTLDGLGGQRIRLDPQTASQWFELRLLAGGATPSHSADPCALPKARKNDVEIDGTRKAHRRDGVALTRFLAWLNREGPGGGITELSAVEKLAGFRQEGEHFVDESFDTISGAGANGAIIHYRVTEASNAPIEPGDVYLVDSGGQYLDGTTDVTRTVYIPGPGDGPSDEVRDRFTRVLKGHIALAMARFPVGTSGAQLDVLARQPLWNAGLDYDHGTGHGVGSYLGVHEGPQRIHKGGGGVPLETGMILSNEPGYYREGAYGIRIESLVAVHEVREGTVAGSERPLLTFETLTMAPIDPTLVDPTLLSQDELDWFNAYHQEVRESLVPLLSDEDGSWLTARTQPVG